MAYNRDKKNFDHVLEFTSTIARERWKEFGRLQGPHYFRKKIDSEIAKGLRYFEIIGPTNNGDQKVRLDVMPEPNDTGKIIVEVSV